ERLSLQVLVVPGLLADQDESRGGATLAENRLGRILEEGTAAAAPGCLLQGLERQPCGEVLHGADTRFLIIAHDAHAVRTERCSYRCMSRVSTPRGSGPRRWRISWPARWPGAARPWASPTSRTSTVRSASTTWPDGTASMRSPGSSSAPATGDPLPAIGAGG